MWAIKLSRLKGVGIGPKTDSYINWCGPIAMVPCLHQGNIYFKRKLWVWRDQKLVPLVCAKTLTCADRQTISSQRSRYRPENANLRKFGLNYRHGTMFTPKQYLYQRVWRDQKCIPLLGAKNPLTCAGRQTTPSQGSR